MNTSNLCIAAGNTYLDDRSFQLTAEVKKIKIIQIIHY